MHTVYLLRSIPYPQRKYIGLTEDIERRLTEHNRGNVKATEKNHPWDLVVSLSFKEEEKAEAFEAYLKSASGRACADKHLWGE